MRKEYDVEQEWEFWKGIVCNEDGTINIDQLKKELCDFSVMINEVPKVYCEVTGNAMSKPLYYADDVIAMFNEKYGNKAASVDYLADDWDIITADCKTNEDYKKAIFRYLYYEE